LVSGGITEPEAVIAPGQTVEAGKWVVAASVLLGAFLSVMDTTVVNVAMPHMMGSFGTDLMTITWVSTAYSIAEIIQITMAGWPRCSDASACT
jgi:MFS transporter, DHA2 family, multidrug resistance protein